MANLRVPDSDRDALIKLLALSAAEATSLGADLEACDGQNGTIIAILDKYVGDGQLLLGALTSLQVAIRRFGISPQDMEFAVKSSFGVSESSVPLAELLNVRVLRRYSKALELRNAYERIATATRIVSDIRPVFPDGEIGDRVDAALINHTLRISFKTGEEADETYFAVDEKTLRALKDQIDRAIAKESAARTFIVKGSATVLQPLEENE